MCLSAKIKAHLYTKFMSFSSLNKMQFVESRPGVEITSSVYIVIIIIIIIIIVNILLPATMKNSWLSYHLSTTSQRNLGQW
jgi:hypothetical protein